MTRYGKSFALAHYSRVIWAMQVIWATWILHIFVIIDVVNYSDNKGDNIKMIRKIFF